MNFLNPPSRLGYCDPISAMIVGGGMVAGGVMSKPGDIQAPEQRNYLREMENALRAQEGIQEKLVGLESKYTPMWQRQQQRSLMGGMNSINQLYGSAMPMASNLGQRLTETSAPLYAQAGQSAMNAYTGMLGGQAMGIYQTMGQQAQQGLNAGYGLNEQQTQLAQQSARAAMAARGMGTGNQAIAQEVLNSYTLGNARYQQNLGNAQNFLNTTTQAAGQAYNMYGQPLMSQINQVSAGSLMGLSNEFNAGLGAKIFNPESQYNADIYGANQANEMNTRLANLQAGSAFSSALIGGGATIAGAGLKAKT